MASITVSSNPSTTGDTLTVNFTTDATNITDVLISKDGGSTYTSATSFTSSKAVFNVSSWSNGTYNNCKLKCVYTETSGGGGTGGSGEITTESGTFGALLSKASTWYVIGDSISDTNLLPQTKYMTVLGNKFSNLTINNVGKDGSHFTNKTTGYSTFATLLAKLPSGEPSVITIFGGVNDYIQSCTIGNIDSTDTSNFYGALNDFVTTLKNKYANTKKLFIIPLNMRAGVFSTNSNGTNSIGNTLQQYRDAIIAVCNANNIEYIDLHEDAELQPDLISSDGLHPTQDGHELLAAKLSACKISSSSSGGGTTESYTTADISVFSTVGKCSDISIDSSHNLVAGTLGQWGMVKLNKTLTKLKFTVRDSVADYGALCWYIYNDNGDGTYNMIALGNISAGENGKRFKMTIPGTGATQIDKLEINTINVGETLTIEISGDTQTIYRQDGSKLVTLTGNMSGWCGQSSNSSPFCSNIQYMSGASTTETLTISNISNITQPEKTEFYIEYTTNIAVVKHEVSWDGGNTFYDKTTEVTSNGTTYKFKHDNKASAGTYQMAIKVTTAKGTTKTSNIFNVTLTSTVTPEPTTPTPVYELADTVFDGSSKYVDTGVKPFKTASDYTIFIDFDDYGASQGQQPYLFHCAYENADGDGLKVYYNNEDNHYYIIGNRQNTSDGTYESSWTLVGGQNNKIAIAISKGVVSQIVINGSAVAVTKNEYDMNDYSLILGAYQDAQCNKSKYWKGTIHTCKVWNEAFTVAKMKELCGSSSSGGDSGSGDAYRPGRALLWEDDFTGTTLNTDNWDYENNYSRPNEVQNYVAGTNNVWVENSNLVIKAKRESSNGKEWSSGCIHTDNKQEFMYGRFEAKIKIPQTIGSFPAFWTLGGNYEEGGGITWPYCGEIDIMEHKYGYAWTTAGALYRTDLVWDNWDAKDLGRVDSGNIGSFDDYHIYAMEWTANKLDYYVDDRLIGHSDISDDSQWFMFHQPHYILLNQALGAAGGSVPSDMTEYTMYVDWVRVYAPEEAPSGGGTSNQIWFEDTSARSMGKWSKLGLILKFNESWNNKVVTWKSSNTDIATVCGGRVDSKGTAGSCIITATTLEGNEASITVNVS